MSQYEDHWTDKEKTERARRWLLEKGHIGGTIGVAANSNFWFERFALHSDPLTEKGVIYSAAKRACGIHAGRFRNEPYLEPGYFEDGEGVTPDKQKEDWLSEQDFVATALICHDCKEVFIVGAECFQPIRCGHCGSEESTEPVYLTPHEFGQTEDATPDYPKQWLEHLSEEAAEWLYTTLKEYRFQATKYQAKDIPSALLINGFVDKEPGTLGVYSVSKAPFLTGGLELPDCIDESDLD